MSARGAERFISVWRLLRTVARKFVEDHGWILASALAFNLLLYFIPLSLLMISLLGYTVLDSERAMQEVQAALKSFLPRSQHDVADNLAAVVADRGLLGFFGFASFFVFSTFVFSSARTALNRVFQVKEERSLVKGAGVDFMMIGLMALLLLLAFGVTGFLTMAGAFAERYPSWNAVLQPGLAAFGKAAAVVVTGLLFYVLYRFSPAETLSSRGLLVASASGTLLFQFARWGFAWYVRFAPATIELYGTIGSVMFFFVWLYYASAVFIVGAEVGWAYDQEKARAARSQSVA
ncbi:MAG: YihY/virulence factor BrkB family protein [Nitrospira sp.]|nr:YihY/virulence factor BrkB family protein [Nitrospira sp.]MDH5251973.1 YihY/virulence factor BrkB family protein [Nitrospira sp.]